MRCGHTVKGVIARFGPPLAERGPIVVILALLAVGMVAMVRSAPPDERGTQSATTEAGTPAPGPTPTASARVGVQSRVVLIVASEDAAAALRSKLAGGGLAGVRDSLVSVVALSETDEENRVFRAMILGNDAMCAGACGHVAMFDLRER